MNLMMVRKLTTLSSRFMVMTDKFDFGEKVEFDDGDEVDDVKVDDSDD